MYIDRGQTVCPLQGGCPSEVHCSNIDGGNILKKFITKIFLRFLEEILALFSEDVFLGNIFPVLGDYVREI